MMGDFFCWNGKKTLGRNQHFPRIPTKQGILIGKAYCIVYLCGVAFVSLFQHRSRCRVVCVNCHCQDNGGVWCRFSGYILGATSRCAHKRNNNSPDKNCFCWQFWETQSLPCSFVQCSIYNLITSSLQEKGKLVYKEQGRSPALIWIWWRHNSGWPAGPSGNTQLASSLFCAMQIFLVWRPASSLVKWNRYPHIPGPKEQTGWENPVLWWICEVPLKPRLPASPNIQCLDKPSVLRPKGPTCFSPVAMKFKGRNVIPGGSSSKAQGVFNQPPLQFFRGGEW